MWLERLKYIGLHENSNGSGSNTRITALVNRLKQILERRKEKHGKK
jgi:hypothetical protein